MSPTPLELLLEGRYQELLARMRNPSVRGQLLAEVLGSVNPQAGVGADASIVLEQRQLNMLAGGDWSWGILTPQQRRQFLIHDARLLGGSGTPDAGAAQLAALMRLRGELGNLYESLDLALQDGDLSWLLPLAKHLASLLEITGEFASMLERYSALLAAAERLANPRLELHARLGLSLALCNLGRYGDAEAEAGTAAQLAAAQDSLALQAAALHLGGSAHAMAADYAAARKLLLQALELRRGQNERRGVIATMSNLAYVEQCQGRRNEATALLQEALGICRELGDCRGEAMFLQNLGALDYGAGNYSEAAELAQQALAIYNTLDDRPGIASALCALGFTEYGAERHADAQVLLEQALGACRTLGDRSSESLALITLGNLAWLAEDAATALGQYTLALDLCRESGDRQGEARAMCGLGHHAVMVDNTMEAAGWYAQALALFADIGELPGIADCLVYAAGLLSTRPQPSTLLSAARVLATAQIQATVLRHKPDPLDRKIANAVQLRIEAALAAGVLSAAELAQIADQSRSGSLAEEAQAVLQALEQAWPGRG